MGNTNERAYSRTSVHYLAFWGMELELFRKNRKPQRCGSTKRQTLTQNQKPFLLQLQTPELESQPLPRLEIKSSLSQKLRIPNPDAESNNQRRVGGWLRGDQQFLVTDLGFLVSAQGWFPSQGFQLPNQGLEFPKQGFSFPNRGFWCPNQGVTL